jgi:hypothetical protein
VGTLRSAGNTAVATCLLLLAATTQFAADQGMVRLEALGRALQAQRVWQASYHQEYVAAGMTEGEREDGTVWAAWPDRALFVAGGATPRQLGLDGRRVRLLDPELETCDDHRLTDDEWARVPLAAVLEPSRAVDRFTVLDAGERGFALVPREPGGVSRVEVELGEAGLPTEVTIVDPQGSVNRLRFEGWTAAKAPPRWLPDPPVGVDCTAVESDG